MSPANKKIVDHAIKYISLAMMISGLVVGVLRVTAAPYVKSEIQKSIELNNQWLEKQYAGKNELLVKIYELQKENSEDVNALRVDISNLKGRLNK